jgi:RNA polymerase sigma-70 factor (ECF subfamily)
MPTETAQASQAIDVKEYYTMYGPMVYRQCCCLLKSRDKALDATQEVFFKLFLRRDSMKVRYPMSLLYRMATNYCLDRLRQDRKFVPGENLDLLNNLPYVSPIEDRLMAENVLAYILKDEKSEAHQVAVLFFLNGLNIREIVAETGLSRSRVYQHLERLKGKLRMEGKRERKQEPAP